MRKKNPKKKNKTSFKPGNKASVGNKGRKGLVPVPHGEARKYKTIDNFLIGCYLNNNSHSTIQELKEKLEDPRTTALEGAIMQLLVRAFETGDRFLIDFVLDRTIGKVSAKLEIKSENQFQGMTVQQLVDIKKGLEKSNTETLHLIEAEFRPVSNEQQEETTNDKVNGDSTSQS